MFKWFRRDKNKPAPAETPEQNVTATPEEPQEEVQPAQAIERQKEEETPTATETAAGISTAAERAEEAGPQPTQTGQLKNLAPEHITAPEEAHDKSPEMVPGEHATVPVSQQTPEERAGSQVPRALHVDANEQTVSDQPAATLAHPELSPQEVEPDEAPGLAGAAGDVSTVPDNPLLDALGEGELTEQADEIPVVKKGFFTRLAERLTRTKTALVEKVRSVIKLHGKIDEEMLEEIEEILIQSDVGVETTMKIVEKMRKEGRKEGAYDPDALIALFKNSIEEILHDNHRRLNVTAGQPTIILLVGVNGTGKTTTIGKIAKQQIDQGRRVMMVAADTFRAAATDQLAVWAERTGAMIVRKPEGSDPASVVYEAMDKVEDYQPDLVLIDTAGRLHTKLNLMEELKKIVRVIQKRYSDAPHETILVLDATTGQNAINQVRIFHEACTLTGLIMTKLDGTAKGGVLIACKDLHRLPILKIGIGEGADDLRDFDPREFVDALFSNGSISPGNGEAAGQ